MGLTTDQWHSSWSVRVMCGRSKVRGVPLAVPDGEVLLKSATEENTV